jgi:hypothetical protein
MPVAWQDISRWPLLLNLRLPNGASVEQIADAVTDIWIEIDRVLHPIVGHRGVAALYHRSLKVSAAGHPWLSPANPGLLAEINRDALRAALVGQTPDDARAGALDQLEAFCTLLASLVGASLTARLLAPVWAPSEGEPPAQEVFS